MQSSASQQSGPAYWGSGLVKKKGKKLEHVFVEHYQGKGELIWDAREGGNGVMMKRYKPWDRWGDHLEPPKPLTVYIGNLPAELRDPLQRDGFATDVSRCMRPHELREQMPSFLSTSIVREEPGLLRLVDGPVSDDTDDRVWDLPTCKEADINLVWMSSHHFPEYKNVPHRGGRSLYGSKIQAWVSGWM